MNVKYKVSQKANSHKVMGKDQLWSGRRSTLLSTVTMLCSATKTVLEHSELTLAVSVRMGEIFLDFDDIVGYKNLALSD